MLVVEEPFLTRTSRLIGRGWKMSHSRPLVKFCLVNKPTRPFTCVLKKTDTDYVEETHQDPHHVTSLDGVFVYNC